MKTVRRRSGQVFVGLRASLIRGDLDQQAQNVAEAYVQWESQPLTLYNGARIASGYVLWLPESLLVQPSTDGLVLGDAPPPAQRWASAQENHQVQGRDADRSRRGASSGWPAHHRHARLYGARHVEETTLPGLL